MRPPSSVAQAIELRDGAETYRPEILPHQRWSYKKTTRAIKKFTAAAIADHKELHELVLSYFPYLQKRWSKKSRGQRQRLLLELVPNMPATVGEDFELYRRGIFKNLTERQKNIYLCPQINLEQLVEDTPLLMWLLARAEHPPHTFLFPDLQATSLLHNFTELGVFPKPDPKQPGLHFLHINLLDQAELYGVEVVLPKEEFENAVLENSLMPSGVAVRVSEIQAKINRFLVECCHRILHDLPKLVPQPQPSTPFSMDNDNDPSALTRLMACRAYMKPGELRFREIATTIEGRLEALEDQIWTLREDPGYFGDFMSEVSTHVLGPEHIKKRADDPFSLLCEFHLTRLFTSLRHWTALHGMFLDLGNTIQQHGGTVFNNGALHHDVARKIMRLMTLLQPAVANTTAIATVMFFGSPQHRDKYTFSDNGKGDIIMCPERKLSPAGKQIEWLLHALFKGEAEFLGYGNFAVELGKYLNSSDLEVHDMISPLTADCLPDLAVLILCRTELDVARNLVQHSFSTPEECAEAEEAVQKEDVFGSLFFGFLNETCKFTLAADPRDGKFKYVAHKASTKDNVEAMRNAEVKLDDFWEPFLQHMDKRHIMPPELAKLFASRTLSRTPEWVQSTSTTPSSSPPADIDTNTELLKRQFDECMSLANAKRNFDTIASKTKEKTRPFPSIGEDASRAKPESRPQIRPPSPNKQKPVFFVDNRAFKVFRILFHTPSADAQPGELSWKDFLHAMTSIEFGVVHLYGSVWQFSSSRHGAIQFHDPHTAKMRFDVARRIGRRLARKFGWEGDCFQMK